MLSVNHLSRRYGQFLAVDDVSFSINSGEIVGLLGHNGAGKTTIMKMLSGYLEPDQGEILLDNHPITTDPLYMQKQLGYLPENLPVYGDMVVADYLDYVAEMKQLGDSKTSEIKRVVEATEIGDKLFEPIANLSRGYKQRVGVAQAILGDPKLLILDEPTNGLDPTQTEHMRQLIKQIARQATVILSTHIMQEVEAICDRVLILSAGRLVVDSPMSELRDTRNLQLNTSLPYDRVQQALCKVEGVANVSRLAEQSDSQMQVYRIELSDVSRNQVAARVARAIVEAGGDIYQLINQRRDLETLFKEVSHHSPVESQQKEKQSEAA